MRVAAIPAVAFIIMAVSGCGRTGEAESRLERIESEVMDVHPDSALMILESMTADELPTDRARALHGMLLAQARHKNYIDQTDDRDVSSACRYFSDHGDDRRAMKAFFYRAVIQEESTDYAHAIVSAMISEEYAEELKDIYFLAKINELYSDIFNETFNVEQWLKHVRLAAELYSKAGYHTNYVCSMIDYARALTYNGEPVKSIELLDSISPMCQKEDSTIIAYHISSYLTPYIRIEDFENAKNIFNKLNSFAEYFSYSIIDYEEAFITDYMTGNASGSKKYMDILTTYSDSIDDPVVEHSLYKYYKLIGDDKNAFRHIERCYESMNSKTRDILHQSTSISQRNYLAEKNRKDKRQARKLMLRGVILLSFIILVSIFSIIYHRNKLRINRLEMDRKIGEIQNLYLNLCKKDELLGELNSRTKEQEAGLNQLSGELENKNIKLQKLNSMVEGMFRERFSTLNDLCDEYFMKKDSDKARQTIYKGVENIIKDIRSQSSLKEIESTLNELRDGIMARLDKQFPNLKPVDRTFLLLTYAGLPTRTICVICEITVGNYYNKRQRLKSRFEASDAPDAHMFIKYMDN